MVKWATGIGGDAKSEKVKDALDLSDDDNDDDLKSAKKSVGFGHVADDTTSPRADPNLYKSTTHVDMDDDLFDLGNMSIAELSLSELNYDHSADYPSKGGGGFTHHEDTIMEEDEDEDEEDFGKVCPRIKVSIDAGEEEEKKVDDEENKSMYRMSRIALGHGASFVDHMAAKDGKCPFDHENMIAEEKKDMGGEEETKKQGTPSMTPREAVLDAIQTNAAAGNENAGYLSFTHGFAPVLTPVTHFPPEFEAWNELVSNLPYLLSSRKLRIYCDDTSKLPVLDATKLDPIFALRAANVLGFISHAYWNLGDGIPASKKLPAGLETPWITVSKVHLDRTQGPHFLGFFEQVTANFQFLDGQLPTPSESYNCAWANDTLKEYGSVEYDPAGADVSNYQPSLFLSGTSEERNFFGVITEFQLVGAPVVKLIVEILEIAQRGEGVEELKDRMKQLLKLLEKLTFSTFNKIQQQPKAPHYVDPTVWCKVVAPVAVPITSTSLGPSGTASPMIHVLDAFFGRIKHEQFIGKELKGLFDSFPRNWRNFMIAVQQAPSIGEFVDKSHDTELQGLFGACLRQYAEENGFLGRHKLKMLGYIEVAMKLGRDSTIGGVAGLLKDRAWDNIAKELQVGQNERFAIPLKAGALQHVGRVIPISEENLQGNKRAYQIRIDTKGSGIQLEPGSHVGVLYESSADSIWTTLLAFADGDKIKAKDLGKNYMVDLNLTWRKALIQREEYHDATSYLETPTQLNLETFLQWGELRPASRQMLEMAHRASFSKEIHAILNHGLEATLTFSDVVTILKRDGVDLLIKDQANEGDDIDFAALKKNLRKNSDGMNEGGLAGRKSRMTAAAMGGSSDVNNNVFQNTGVKKSLMKKMTVSSKSFHTVKEKILSVVKHVPKLCELIQPAKFRHYSVASSPLVHPTELHLYVGHLKYDTPSAVIQTSPLLAETQEKVLQRGAASDYLVSLSFPRFYLAIAALASQAGLHIDDKDFEAKAEDLEFPLTEDGQDLLKHQAHLKDEEVEAILRRAKTYSGGQNLMKNLITAIKESLKDKPDPRDRHIILKSYSAPRFRLPECFTAKLLATKDTVPVIMIAGGTGLAPFRAFWQQLASAKPPANGERHLLLIGQRTRELMAFEDEIITMVKAGIMDVEIIFSRDEVEPSFAENEIEYKSCPGRRGYIDKIIKDPAMYERLSRMMANGAYFYLCGAGAFAKTAVDALPQKELEGMVAENRMVLDIFTSLVQPKIRDRMDLSELCQCNDFVGVRKGGEKRLLMVINATVYDMRRFFHLHPGGDAMLKLYCGMDATKAWVAVKHNEAPEVVAMLEMITAEKTLRNVEGHLSESDKEWYKHGWKAMTMSLLEIQNALSLAFQKNWDSGVYSAAEKDLPSHFVAWQGKSLWRPKRSLLKGEYFVATHNRLWSLFVPSLLSDDFDEIRSGLGIDSEIDIIDGMEELEDMPEHRICDAICTLIKQELDKLSANQDSIAMPSDLQSFVEEVRIADDALLESIKSHLIKGLRHFENHKSPLLPAFHSKFFMSVMGIIGELKTFIAKVASLAIAQFGEEHVLSVANSPDLKRGGITLVGSSDLDNVTKEFMDGDQVKTAGVVEAGHDHASSVPKCPMHI